MATVKGYLAQLRDLKRATEVAINEVLFKQFTPSSNGQTVSIGVCSLSACSVVIIASQYGAIVAHIGPNIEGSSDPDSYKKLAEQKMDEVSNLYQQYRTCFPANTKTYVIVATIGGNVLTAEQKDIMTRRMTALGFPDTAEIHRPVLRFEHDDQPEGTVVVEGDGQKFQVLLEDKSITDIF